MGPSRLARVAARGVAAVAVLMAAITAAVIADRNLSDHPAPPWAAPPGFEEVDVVTRESTTLHLWIRAVNAETCWMVESRRSDGAHQSSVSACSTGTPTAASASAVLGGLVGRTSRVAVAKVRVDAQLPGTDSTAKVHNGVFLVSDLRPPGAGVVQIDEFDDTGKQMTTSEVSVT